MSFRDNYGNPENRRSRNSGSGSPPRHQSYAGQQHHQSSASHYRQHRSHSPNASRHQQSYFSQSQQHLQQPFGGRPSGQHYQQELDMRPPIGLPGCGCTRRLNLLRSGQRGQSGQNGHSGQSGHSGHSGQSGQSGGSASSEGRAPQMTWPENPKPQQTKREEEDGCC